jgi:predicted dehydrogenase
LARAQSFASQWAHAGLPGSRPDGVAAQATTDLAELLRWPQVNAVYIATPHAFHAAAIAQCLEAGKPVLCEKSMVTDAPTARRLSALSQERGVFLMEAMWTRYLPIYAAVGQWLREGRIGRLHAVQSSFCFNRPYDPTHRLYDAAQAGGALLDIGIYSLSVLHWSLTQAFGHCPPLQQLHAEGVMWPTGTDRRVAATLSFGEGLSAQILLAMDARSPNQCLLIGERGSIVIGPGFNAATRATLTAWNDAPLVVDAPHAVNGFEGEIAEVQACVASGLIESQQMRKADTVTIMEWIDAIRAQIGLRYPFDPAPAITDRFSR